MATICFPIAAPLSPHQPQTAIPTPYHLHGIVTVPPHARMCVLFVQSTGDSHLSIKSRKMAHLLNDTGMATVLHIHMQTFTPYTLLSIYSIGSSHPCSPLNVLSCGRLSMCCNGDGGCRWWWPVQLG